MIFNSAQVRNSKFWLCKFRNEIRIFSLITMMNKRQIFVVN